MALSLPYLFLLPPWAVAVLAMAAATMATRVAPRLRPAYPYAWRILLWSNIGFVAANVLVQVFYPVLAAVQVGLDFALVAAPIGCVLAGIVAGIWLAHRATRERP